MYLLLLILHSAFILITHLLGYRLLEGIFIVLLLFFLLYFSPIFFSKKEDDTPFFSFSQFNFSLRDSIFLPLIFVYTAVFLLLFAVTHSISQSVSFGEILLAILSIMLWLYSFAFNYRTDIYFEFTKAHISISYGVLFLMAIFSFFLPTSITIYTLLFLSITLLFSIFYFSHSRGGDILFFQGFLLLSVLTPFLFWTYGQQVLQIGFLTFSVGIMSILFFELMPRMSFFSPFLPTSRTYVLVAFLFSYVVSMVMSFFDPSYYFLLLVGIVFLFVIHIRFSNYISLIGAILGIFILYGIIFYSMMTPTSILSTLLFVFFLPVTIIGNTYFWEERFPYDLRVLHYSSILFSIITSLYSIFFLSWGSSLLFALSFFILGVGLLLFLSYFRFRSLQ